MDLEYSSWDSNAIELRNKLINYSLAIVKNLNIFENYFEKSKKSLKNNCKELNPKKINNNKWNFMN